MATTNLTTQLKVQLDKSGIPAELKQIQKIVDKYPIKLTTDLQASGLKKQYKSICQEMANELNKTFKSNLSGADIFSAYQKNARELADSYMLAANAAYKLNGEAQNINKVIDGQNNIAGRNRLALAASRQSLETLSNSLKVLQNSWSKFVNSILTSDGLKTGGNLLNSLVQSSERLARILTPIGSIVTGTSPFAGLKNVGSPKMFGLYHLF